LLFALEQFRLELRVLREPRVDLPGGLVEHLARGDRVPSGLVRVRDLEHPRHEVGHSTGPVAFPLNATQLKHLGRGEDNQQDRHQRGGAESESMTQRVFPQAIRGRGRARDDGFVAQVPLNVGGELRRRGVASATVFLQRFQRDPIQIALQAPCERSRLLVTLPGRQRGSRTTSFLFALPAWFSPGFNSYSPAMLTQSRR
jgi:hypothetical protein